jgi:hypothetical protein
MQPLKPLYSKRTVSLSKRKQLYREAEQWAFHCACEHNPKSPGYKTAIHSRYKIALHHEIKFVPGELVSRDYDAAGDYRSEMGW